MPLRGHVGLLCSVSGLSISTGLLTVSCAYRSQWRRLVRCMRGRYLGCSSVEVACLLATVRRKQPLASGLILIGAG